MTEIKEVQCFLLDMDGTIYLSDQLISGATEFIKKIRDTNRDFYFFTNNSSKSARDYCLKLKKLGILVSENRIITSGEVTAEYVLKHGENQVVYLVGTPSLKKEFIEKGIEVTDDKSKNIDFLVLGFDKTLTYQKLWDAHDLILSGVKYIATNPDYVCPLAGGKSMPDCGSMISLLKTSTGRKPLVIGKPNTMMIDYIAEKADLNKNKLALIGDRLYTDIKTANNAEIISILTLSGESTRDDLEKSEEKPDFIINSVMELIDIL